jgi:hypothetical protein
MHISVYVGNNACNLSQLEGNARSSLHEAIEDFIGRLAQAPDSFLVEYSIHEDKFYLFRTDAGHLADEFQHYLYHNGPWPIHPMQPGILFFAEQVTIQFNYIQNNDDIIN